MAFVALPAVTTAQMRAYARWPDAILDTFLSPHLDGACRDVAHELGGVVAAGMDGDATEAILCRAVASALPFVQTFTQDGAASAIRSAQMASSRPHFQGSDDQASIIKRLLARADFLLDRLRQAASRDTQLQGEALGTIFMGVL